MCLYVGLLIGLLIVRTSSVLGAVARHPCRDTVMPNVFVCIRMANAPIITWISSLADGHGHERQRCPEGSVVQDVTTRRLFHLVNVVQTGSKETQFKGYYVDEVDVVVERNAAHFRTLINAGIRLPVTTLRLVVWVE